MGRQMSNPKRRRESILRKAISSEFMRLPFQLQRLVWIASLPFLLPVAFALELYDRLARTGWLSTISSVRNWPSDQRQSLEGGGLPTPARRLGYSSEGEVRHTAG